MDSERTGSQTESRSYRALADRFSMPRRRVVSASAGTSSASSTPRCTLAEWQPQSTLDLRGSRRSSQLNVESVLGKHLTSRPSSPLSPLSVSAETKPAPSVEPVRKKPKPRLSKDLPPPPAPETPEETDLGRRPSVKGFFSNISSRITHKKPESRRPSATTIDSDRTAVQEDPSSVSGQRVLSVIYDPDTRRFTGSDNWPMFFPWENSDPFADLEVKNEDPKGTVQSLTRFLKKQAVQTLEGLKHTVKSKIPATFNVQIRIAKPRSSSEGTQENDSPIVIHMPWIDIPQSVDGKMEGGVIYDDPDVHRSPNNDRHYPIMGGGADPTTPALPFPTHAHRRDISETTVVSADRQPRHRTRSSTERVAHTLWKGLQNIATSPKLAQNAPENATPFSLLKQTPADMHFHPPISLPMGGGSPEDKPRGQQQPKPSLRSRLESITRLTQVEIQAQRRERVYSNGSKPPASGQPSRTVGSPPAFTYRPSKDTQNKSPMPRSPYYI